MNIIKKIVAGIVSAFIIIIALSEVRSQATQSSTSLRSNVVQYTRDLTVATGSVAYTGMGFRPRSCLFLGAIDGASSAVSGAVGSNLSSGNISIVPTGLVTTTSHAMRVYTDSGFANSQLATLSSFDADGFTLSWTKVSSPTGTLTFNAFCIL